MAHKNAITPYTVMTTTTHLIAGRGWLACIRTRPENATAAAVTMARRGDVDWPASLKPCVSPPGSQTLKAMRPRRTKREMVILVSAYKCFQRRWQRNHR